MRTVNIASTANSKRARTDRKILSPLKNEYGTGGGTHIFPDGFSGHSWHDSKGLAIDRNGTYTNHDLVLKWSQVEKRLRELIKDNRYLNPKEKDHYADYLESVSAPQYEIDTQRKIARQRFIDAHRDLPPADKRDTLLCGYLTLSETWTGTKKTC